METYKNYQIRKSGPTFYRIYENGKSVIWAHRTLTIDAAKVLIDCHLSGKVMTREQWEIVHANH